MKFILIISFLFLATLELAGQTNQMIENGDKTGFKQFGIKAGWNASTIRPGISFPSNLYYQSVRSEVGIQFGASFRLWVKKNIEFHTGLIATQRGFVIYTYTDSKTTQTSNSWYLDVPANMVFYLQDKKVRVGLLVGIMPSIGLGGTESFYTEPVDPHFSTYYNEGKISFNGETENAYTYNRFDLSGNLGFIYYPIDNLLFSLIYSHGFTNIDHKSNSFRNFAISISWFAF